MTAINDIWGLTHELDERARVKHIHRISEILGLTEALHNLSESTGQPGTENIVLSSVSGLAAALDSKAPVEHNHPIADITGLTAALDSKPSEEMVIDLLTGLQSEIASKAAAVHTHQTATAQADGFMSAADKTKLDSLGISGGINTNPQQLPYTLSQSSIYGNTPAGTYQTLTDGSFTTGTGTNSDSLAWLRADLGSVQIISEIWIGGGSPPGDWGNSSNYLNLAALEISRDGNNWAIAIPRISGITDTSVSKFALGLLVARYVRLRNTGTYIGACEFRIFG